MDGEGERGPSAPAKRRPPGAGQGAQADAALASYVSGCISDSYICIYIYIYIYGYIRVVARVQVKGRKRMLLWPAEAIGAFDPYPLGHPLYRRARVDIQAGAM